MESYIRTVCDEMADFLVEKNKAYGNSITDPVRIFSKVDVLDQIDVRIDDKLSRLARGSEFDGDDTYKDLAGYLILRMAVKRYLDRCGADEDVVLFTDASTGKPFCGPIGKKY